MQKRTTTGLIAGLLLVGNGTPAAAATLDAWLKDDYATGDWGGAREKLIDAGITPEITYTTDILTLLKGGLDDGNGSSYAGRAELNLNFDLDKLFGLKGTRFYIEGAWSSGQDISSRHIGNLFPAAQIFTGNGVLLSEMYFEQNLVDGKVSLALGRLTTENDFLASTIYENYVNGGINGTPFGIPSGQPGFTTNPFTYAPRESFNINPVFVGAGLVYQGPIPTRDADVAAIGFYYGKLSRRIEDTGSEKVFELAYTAQLTPWFYVRPDFQYILDPSGDAAIDDAVVFGGEIGIVF